MTKWELIKSARVDELGYAYGVDLVEPADFKTLTELINNDFEADAQEEYKRMLAEGVFEDGEIYGY